jgi:hypothetical protein
VSSWIDFGDGTVVNATTANHTYDTPGTYTITATIYNNSGRSSRQQATVTVNTVNPAPPTPLSVTPNSGSGTSQTFTVQYSDVNGRGYIGWAETLMNSSLSYAGSCAVGYDGGTLMYLINDAGSSWGTGMAVGSSGTLQNSQCSVNLSGVTISGSGNVLSVTLPLTFKAGFTGTRTIYGAAHDRDNRNSGWSTLGTWTPNAVATPPTAVSVTPNSGSGMSQTFTVRYSDVNGWGYIGWAETLINSSLSYAGSCAVGYDGGSLMYLINDAGSSWGTGMAVGSSGTLQNSQCSLNLSGVTISGSGNVLSISFPLTFKSGFSGTKTIFGAAHDRDYRNSGWSTLGNWAPNAVVATPPSAVSVSPNAGSGTSQTFTLQYSDVNGGGYIGWAETLINSSLSYAGSCAVGYDGGSLMYLMNDAGSSWGTGMAVGSSGTLQNSQCSLSLSGVTISGSGNVLNVSLPLTFQSGFSGTKTIFGAAHDRDYRNSGFATLGTWTVTTSTAVNPINHVIFLLQENRSFDNYFGFLNAYRASNGWTTGDDG